MLSSCSPGDRACSAAWLLRIVTHTISTASTHKSRFSFGTLENKTEHTHKKARSTRAEGEQK